MHAPTLPKLLLASAIALSLAACGSDDDAASDTPPVVTTPIPPVEAGDTVILTSANRLLSYNMDNSATLRTGVTITGMQSGENMVGIDYRPADGLLYGVGSTGRLYTIDPTTGVATQKSTLSADATDTTNPFTAMAGTEFGVDFNPVPDRLRVVSNTGQNLRINVDTGATTTDGNINGGAANTVLTAAAYTNSFAGTGSTTLFVLDGANGTLYTQNPPNDGTLASPVALGVTATSVGAFDIDARNNRGYAVMTVGGVRGIYAINLGVTTGAATLVNSIAAMEDVRGIAIRTPAAPTVFGLTSTNRLVSFRPATPNTLATDVAVTGTASGERLIGIDVRPRDGAMIGIAASGRIYTIDTATGAATLKATLAADATDATAPFTAIAGTEFAVDFNPVADRLRVISNSGQNLRINVDTGATTTDGTINRAPALPAVTAAAYTNSFAGTTSTMLLVADADSDSLALQNPPNDGTLVNIGGFGLDVSGDVGMDIAGGANGLVLAALRPAGGPVTLYRVNAATGAATPVNGSTNAALSAIGTGAVDLVDIAIVLK
ncbi:DUF4394 domain-containing protein [Massilia sp. PAMC28688]|uniref:DUF4394 domain-containing protein n=1 Tax=Massilia sp. PAMC28688 TaxID=2861283 RepID=UPI001C626AE0|nr:DUF4394 domain-containing protein [Massilia sp. PAMC28688]QYF93851.1 DUF4394 domain-containing protein [Massilia sp. PAMC28688]